MSDTTTFDASAGAGNNPDAWRTLKVGAGGFVTGIDIANDGTKVVRTDVNGAFLFDDATQVWRPIVTADSMPASVRVNDTIGAGVYEIQIAASDSSRLYMTYLGKVWRSDDKGQHWTVTSLERVNADPNDSFRMAGQKMAIDPNDPDTVIVGTASSGLFVTHDGGDSWTRVSSVPSGKKQWNGEAVGFTGILFDPSSTDASGHSRIAYASSYGNGLYVTANGGSTWTHVEGGPTNVYSAAISKQGVYYAIGDNQSTLWSLDHGTWSVLKTTNQNNFTNVAIDPFNEDHIVINIDSGTPSESLDGGKSWVTSNGGTTDAAPGEVSWIAAIDGWMSAGGIAFDPVEQGKLWFAAGDGVWAGDFSTPLSEWGPGTRWEIKSAGIEELVANDIVVSNSGHPVLASWDRAFFYVDDPEKYATDYSVPGGDVFSAGWSLDYASSDPSFVVGLSSWWGAQSSGYSTDGGQTWHEFSSFPATVNIGGSIAASTPDNIIWAPANKQAPYYTLDGGETWHEIDLPGFDNWDTLHWAYYLNRTTITADRVEPNTFYLYNAVGPFGGVYKTTDGGVSWDKVFNGEISAFSTFNAKIQTVPGEAEHLFFTGGHQEGIGSSGQGFYHSTDGGQSWSALSGVTEVYCFGFGASAKPDGYPAIYIAGFVGGVYGLWQSDDEGRHWTNIGTFPDGNLATVTTISGDPEVYGQVYVGLAGGGYLYLPGHDPVDVPAAPEDGGVPVNQAPVADEENTFDTLAGTISNWIDIGAKDADGDMLTYAIKDGEGPSRGTVEIDQVHGALRYTADRGNPGTDHFVIEIADGQGHVVEQYVEVTIKPGINAVRLYGDATILWNQSAEGQKLEGESGSDVISGNVADDTLIGADGNDQLYGGGGNDVLDGGNGADRMYGGDGIDTLGGAAGNDLLDGGDGADILNGGDGEDTLNGSAGKDVLDGGAGADILNGGSEDDTLNGAAGRDVLDGGAGADVLTGGDGDDTYYVDSLDDKVVEGWNNGKGGTDTVYSSVDFTLSANIEKLVLTGSADASATGNQWANPLTGNAGNNMLTGGAGRDILDGGDGFDTAVYGNDWTDYQLVGWQGKLMIADRKPANGDDGVDQLINIEQLKFADRSIGINSPIVLDLDGNGVSLTGLKTSKAKFDMNGDGALDLTTWFAKGDALLFLDRDGNGTLSDASEFTFNNDLPGAASDLAGLVAFDSNKDGFLNAKDARFGDFKLFADADSDGTVESGEIVTMDAAGVASINLTGNAIYFNVKLYDAVVVNTGTFIFADGHVGAFNDAVLTYQPGQLLI